MTDFSSLLLNLSHVVSHEIEETHVDVSFRLSELEGFNVSASPYGSEDGAEHWYKTVSPRAALQLDRKSYLIYILLCLLNLQPTWRAAYA